MLWKKKKKKRSLAKTLRSLVFRVAVIIFIISTLMCWGFMSTQFAMTLEMMGENLVAGARAVLEMDGGFEEYASSVLHTYFSIPEEIRKDPSSEAYQAFFRDYESEDYYTHAMELLEQLKNHLGMENLYFAALDVEHEALVGLIDPPDQIFKDYHMPGDWMPVGPSVIKALLSEDSEVRTASYSVENFGKLYITAKEMGTEISGIKVFAISEIPEIISGISAAVFVIIYFIVLAVAILLIILITNHRMNKRIIKPVNSISAAVAEYADQRTNGIEATHCFSKLSIKTRDELEDLSRTLSEMEQDIGVFEDNLTKATARQERMNTELQVATGIQSHMLPDAKTAFQDQKAFTVYASMTPAREVGGDFYDFFMIDDTHLGIVIADVSGKGIPAALFMMSSMIIINNLASMGLSPKEVLERANHKICSSNVMDMFVTVWFGILDLPTGVVTAANAGHEYPAVGRADGTFELLRDKHGFVIGGMDCVKYKEYSFTLERGGTLFLYTDGVPEATNASDAFYGTDRMLQALNAAEDKSPEGLGEALRADIDRFVSGAPQFDDLTMVCVQYHPD